MDRAGFGLVLLCFCVGVPRALGQNYVNVATRKTYSQVSKYRDQGTSSNAANGDTGGVYSASNCIHTKVYGTYPYYDTDPWWQVDLGRTYPVYSIKVWARTGFINRLYPFTITVDGQQCATVTSMSSRNVSVTCSSGVMYGQVVRLTRTGSDQPLNLCEFQIFECQTGWYGDTCNTACQSNNCLNNECNQQTGLCTACAGNFAGDYCTGCQTGWYGDTCNTACPSNNCLNNECNQQTGLCAACADNFAGDYCTDCKAGWYGNTCNTRCPLNNCYQCQRQTGTCTKCTGNFAGVDCTGCKDGYHGDKCSETCSPSGQCQRCDQNTGLCSACYSNLTPPSCTVCFSGSYGQDCSESCGHCRYNSACDVVSGACSGCDAGFQPPLCKTGCENGTYGEDCGQTCGHCKDGTACDKVSGQCPFCDPGWSPPMCKTPKSEESDGGLQSLVGPVVGSIFGVGLLLTISLTAAICWRRRSQENLVRTNNPPIALSDKKICTPDPPTSDSTAPVPANSANESVYVEVEDTENTYDKLHPYSNQDAERQQYSQFAPSGRDVDTPTADSAYVNTSLPMGKEDGKI